MRSRGGVGPRLACAFLASILAITLVAPRADGGPPAPELSYTLEGDSTGDRLGTSVCWVPDLDGDGCDDLLAAAPGGYVRVCSGRDGSVLRTLTASCEVGNVGYSVARAGDVDGDGTEDVLTGNRADHHGDVADSGSVWVFSGRDGSVLHTFYGVEKSRLGQTVAPAGDVNGDGYADLIAGGPYATIDGATLAGEVCVFSGRDGKTLYRYTGTQYRDSCGTIVRGAGDVDRDGRDDFLFATGRYDAKTGTHQRWLNVCSGRDGSTLLTIRSPSKVDPFFSAVYAGADLNTDGVPDIAIGSRNTASYSDSPGAVWVVSGRDGLVLREYFGDPDSTDCLGASLSVGDADGDGLADLAVGCANGLRNLVGEVRVFSGDDGTELCRLDGFTAGENFGSAVTLAGDGNGDGRADLAVGAPCGWPFSPDSDVAQVYVFLSPGPTGSLSIDGGARATATRSATLTIGWQALEADVDAMRLRNRGVAWEDWRSPSSAWNWTLSAGEGPKTVDVEFRDADGLRSGPIPASTIFDQTPPTGTISIDGGAAWTSRRDVRVSIDLSDPGSGLAEVRLRSAGGKWSDWIAASGGLPWTLPGEDGLKTVEAEVRDYAGNVSLVAADSIGLDTTPPSAAPVINGGEEFVTARTVTLHVPARDGSGSGLSRMRLRHIGWQSWFPDVPYTDTVEWVLTPQNGLKAVEVVLTDAAGNTSAIARASVVYDDTPPTIDEIWVNLDRPYVLPEEPVEVAVYAHDNPEGSGVSALRARVGEGADWSPWIDVREVRQPEAAHPATPGIHSVRAMAKDRAGNESAASAPREAWFVEAAPPVLGAAGRATGRLSGPREVDALELDLVRGNLLSVRFAAPEIAKGGNLPLALDLVRPSGQRLIERIAAPGLDGLVVPETGRYFLILRADGDGGAPVAWAVSVTGKSAAENVKGRWAGEGSEVRFDAAAGSRVTASVRAPGLDPASVTLEGPDGIVGSAVKGKPGSAKLTAMLNRGTGTYRLHFAASGPVQVSWSVKPPAARTIAEE